MKIVKYPDEKLKKVCEPVTKFDGRLSTLVYEMNKVMSKAGGIGLAASQLGINKRVVLVSGGNQLRTVIPMVNPVILGLEGNIESMESCLSLPGKLYKVPRAEVVIVQYQDTKGKPQVIRAEGLLSICIQHELNHLEGITIADVGEEVNDK
jgi:peptide deformylase